MNQTFVARCLFLFSTLFLFSEQAFSQSSPALSLEAVLHKVFQNDFQLVRSSIDGQAYMAEAESKDVLADPVFFAAMQNIPTDTFELDQEGMTQFKVGVKQMFPKGNSLTLNKNIVLHSQVEQSLQQKQRLLKLRQQVEMAWLEAWYWQKSKLLIEEDRTFLKKLQDFMQSVYQ